MIARLALLVAVFLFSSTAFSQLHVVSSFQGTSQDDSNTGSRPDTHGAAGPNHFVEVGNSFIAIYNKSTSALIQRMALSTFFASLCFTTGTYQDPRIVYDPGADRWYLSVFVTGASDGVLFAVSRGGDPTLTPTPFSKWHSLVPYSTPVSGVDYPTLGYNTDAIFIATRVNSSVSFVVIDKASALGCASTCSNCTTCLACGITRYSLVIPSPLLDQDYFPAIASDTGATFPHPMIGRTSNTIVEYDLTGTPGQLDLVDYAVSGFNTGTSPPTTIDHPAGGTITLATGVRSDVVARGGNVWAVRQTTVSGRSALRWTRVNQSARTAVSGNISHPDLHLYNPAISANQFGDVVIGCTASAEVQSPPGLRASAFAFIGHTINGTLKFACLPIVLRQGAGDLASGVDALWGDYSAVSIDPSNPRRFWVIQEHFKTPSTGGGAAIWSNWVAQVDSCGADYNGDFTVNSTDFFDFLTDYFANDLAADIDGNCQITSQDFLDFQTLTGVGCP